MAIDSRTRTVSTFGSLPSGDAKWEGGVLGLDGLIYGLPSRATEVLVINPKTRTVETFGDLAEGECKWCRGALGLDGSIYARPHRIGEVLEIQPFVPTPWSPPAHRCFPDAVRAVVWHMVLC